MGIKQLYNDNLRKLPNEYGDVSVMLINEKLIDLLESTFQREGSHYLDCNDKSAFFKEEPKNTHFGHAKMCVKLSPCFWIIFVLDLALSYADIVGISMGTNFAPLVADLFLFCYEREFIMSLSVNKDAEVIAAFNSTSNYLNDLF